MGRLNWLLISYSITLNNRLLHILQHKPFKMHTADLYNTYFTLPLQLLQAIRFCSSWIGMCITEMNCLSYFLHILRKNNLFIITIYDIILWISGYATVSDLVRWHDYPVSIRTSGSDGQSPSCLSQGGLLLAV